MKRTALSIALILMAWVSMAQTAPQQRVAREKKPIKEFKVWKNGSEFNASDIDLVCVFDDYETTARLYYQLTDTAMVVVAEGNLEITGADYLEYVRKPNHPDWALDYALRVLKLQKRATTATTQAARQSGGTAPKN